MDFPVQPVMAESLRICTLRIPNNNRSEGLRTLHGKVAHYTDEVKNDEILNHHLLGK